jgi:hypothetical protein
MQELIERLEKATGWDRALDELIACEVHPPHPKHGKPIGMIHAKEYTKSVDAALTLVRPAHEWEAGSAHLAECYWASVVSGSGEWKGKGKTSAIALCIAALKSRHGS